MYGTKFSTPYNKEHMCAREEMVYVSMEQLMTDYSKDPRPEMHNICTKALLVNLGTILFPPLEKNLIASIYICCNDAHGNCSVQSLKRSEPRLSTIVYNNARKSRGNLCYACLEHIVSYVERKEIDIEIYGHTCENREFERLLSEYAILVTSRQNCRLITSLMDAEVEKKYYHTAAHISFKKLRASKTCNVCGDCETQYYVGARGSVSDRCEKYMYACKNCIYTILNDED